MIENLLILIISFCIYLFRLSKIDNCLFRKDENNIQRLCFGSIQSGIVGPFKTLYLNIFYNNSYLSFKIFKELFLTFDNFFFILFITKLFFYFFF